MLPVEAMNDLSENEMAAQRRDMTRTTLEKFERAKILEIYFSRIDGRKPDIVPSSYREIYELDLQEIKSFLLGQHPHDPLLSKIFRIMN
jgi:hypothetical protein